MDPGAVQKHRYHNASRLWRVIALTAIALLAARQAPAEVRSYHIGNSLTWDSRPMWADDYNPGHDAGWHIRGSYYLKLFWDYPIKTTEFPNPDYGMYTQALPGFEWDAVTLQPYQINSLPVTFAQEAEAFVNFIDLTRTNPANADTSFYVLSVWSTLNQINAWDDPTVNEDDTVFVRNRDFYDDFIQRVRADTDANVYMVPTGEVLFEIHRRIQAGEMVEFDDFSAFYRDSTHMSQALGRYVASATMFATLNKQMPDAYQVPLNDPELPAGFVQFTPQQYAELNDVIWDVITASPYTNVLDPALPGDTDSDGDVDDLDLGTSFANFTGPGGTGNTAAHGDTDADGDVDDADLGLTFANYTGPNPPPVPEPTSLALLLMGGLCAMRRRRNPFRHVADM